MDGCAASIDLEGVVNGCLDARSVYKECHIKCLQDMKTLDEICTQLNLKLREPFPDELLKESKSLHPDEYEVEAILDHGQYKCQDWYFVKWKGWESEFNTWEPFRHLAGCRELLKEFHEKHHVKSVGVKRKWNTSNETQRKKLERAYKFISEICKSTENDLATLLKLKGISVKEYESSGRNIKKLKRDLKEMFSSSLLNGSKTKLKKLESYFNPDLMAFANKRKEVLRQLKEWENEINSLTDEKVPILIENNVDLEGPPANFTYITDYKAGEDISLPDDPLIGCECENCYENQKNCCAMQCGGSFAYSKYGYLKVAKGTPIYECNKRCSCGPDCLNRLVQNGRQIKLSIFRTHDGRGWGVKTLEKIKKGAFVMEYVGEIITNEEAERRGKVYDAEGRTYLFDLDYNDGDCPFTVDATFYGNVAHFMNHSCDPNLLVYAVWINNLDPRLPRIAFFARREIRKGEELTFDYLMTGSTGSGMTSPSKGTDVSHYSSPSTLSLPAANSSPSLLPTITSLEANDICSKCLFPELPNKNDLSVSSYEQFFEPQQEVTSIGSPEKLQPMESGDSLILPGTLNGTLFSEHYSEDTLPLSPNESQLSKAYSEMVYLESDNESAFPLSSTLLSSHQADSNSSELSSVPGFKTPRKLAVNNSPNKKIRSVSSNNEDISVMSIEDSTWVLPVQESKTGNLAITNSPLSFHPLSKVSAGSQITQKRIVCKCGTSVCRGYLF